MYPWASLAPPLVTPLAQALHLADLALACSFRTRSATVSTPLKARTKSSPPWDTAAGRKSLPPTVCRSGPRVWLSWSPRRAWPQDAPRALQTCASASAGITML
eukprot:3270975-Pyramimonas_sp.AAC.1